MICKECSEVSINEICVKCQEQLDLIEVVNDTVSR